jgi:hypothetical protein
MAIIGFEAEWMTLVNPAIASVTLPAESIAAKAMELLFRRIDEPGELSLRPWKRVKSSLAAHLQPIIHWKLIECVLETIHGSGC